jgi:hypothetical protein
VRATRKPEREASSAMSSGANLYDDSV